jgi:hypothetical protein
MEEIYLSNALIPSARKRKILELIEHGPSSGEISVTLHEASGVDFKHIEPRWTFNYGTDRQEIEAVVETVDRLIADGSMGDHRYGTATIKVLRRAG